MTKEERKELLEKIVCAKKTYLNKSTMTSGGCYLITLNNVNSGVRVKFRFNDNYYEDGDIVDFVYCLLNDADAYNYARDLADFVAEFGYDNIYDIKAKKAYEGCRKQAERLNKLFNSNELKQVEEILADY